MGMTNSQKISQIIMALRELFKNKDRLVGVDDWDTFIGILVLLEEVRGSLQEEMANGNTIKGE